MRGCTGRFKKFNDFCVLHPDLHGNTMYLQGIRKEGTSPLLNDFGGEMTFFMWDENEPIADLSRVYLRTKCNSPPSFLNADLVIEPNTQTVFGIGLVKSYQLKEGYMSSSNEHDFQMTCHNDGKWIDYQSAETLSYFNGMRISAWDDYDNTTGSCAFTNNGGWWFRNCHQANVNGLYGVRSTRGLSWLMSKGVWIYPSHVIMMVQKP
uniref:Tenascin-N n=1 Tax=Magallana gigas TaxID=29159 RepID=K1QRN7_MAGGI